MKEMMDQFGGGGSPSAPPDSSKCVCQPGYSGATCSVATACSVGSVECDGNGKCHTDMRTGAARCLCNDGFTGAKCEEARSCPKGIQMDNLKSECSGKGTCDKDGGYFCRCDPGYTGSRCEVVPLACNPPTCGDNGSCKYGRCLCKAGFLGAACDRQQSDSCKIDAAGRPCGGPANGICFYGKCICVNGWTLGPTSEVCDVQEP